jgi:hypothetical protein
MSLRYDSLDARVRAAMVEEIDHDEKHNNLYLSARLNGPGRLAWPGLIRDAATNHDDRWLAAELRSRRYLSGSEHRAGRRVSTPINAAVTLAEGEFNRFYMRGLCLVVLEDGQVEVEIYRAKPVANPRSRSQALVGRRVAAADLLHDIRSSVGDCTIRGIPAGPNSGISVRRLAALPAKGGRGVGDYPAR